MLNPKEGSIYLDDKIIESETDVRKFQNMITFISQDTFLFEDTIKNNIIFDIDKKVDEKKLEHVLNFSKVDNFINEFSEGVDYMVGSHSRRISSGQRQRIGIARAIYNLKEILILDEATNALDEKIEKEIFENIYKLRKSKTVIIVSHNINNFKHCDKIYEIINGKVEIKNKF